MGHQHVQAGPSRPAPQHCAGDVFGGVGLGGPARYAASHFPMQNAQAGPSHLRPTHAGGISQPQNFRGVNVDAPMPALPHHSGFANPGDDNPSRPHRTPHSVTADPAFNNVHRGQMAHREREAAYRQSARDLELVSLHQTDHEIGRWVIPDECARHAHNENRRRLHLPEEPPSRLHMNMSREHEQRQQRIRALEPFCISGTSAPQQEMSPQTRERQERQQRIAELRTRCTRNESRRTNQQKMHEIQMAQQTAQARVHERRMVDWNAQHMQNQMRREQETRSAQDMHEEMKRRQAREEQTQRERGVQRILDEMRREQEEHAQQMQNEMRRMQAIEQEEHRRRVAQLEAQHLQNEIRRVNNRGAAAEREENEFLSQRAEQFRREQEAQSDVIRREQEERDRQDAIRYDQAQLHKRLQKLLHRHKLRLLCKHKYKQLRQQLKQDSWISFMRL
ncbi:hypothetical protein PILCRDRAFT_86310 [Piloderma croceum F 1598]|uniref:Uncharacterized protein n=1 Tax=Piloderma croceum (strain F 1598) TaxID=765440 RepID=A0A0C3FQY9_PILCF|nr:hypothetical protein PILCRDRAFT_86310 [Piloderma croceum F 1598]